MSVGAEGQGNGARGGTEEGETEKSGKGMVIVIVFCVSVMSTIYVERSEFSMVNIGHLAQVQVMANARKGIMT